MLEIPIGLDEHGDTIYFLMDTKLPTTMISHPIKVNMNLYIQLINNRLSTENANYN